MPDAYILEAVRTPIGRRAGALSGVRPDDLAAQCLGALVARAQVEPAAVEDVVMGCVTQIGEQGLNVARNAVLAAGWPISVPGTSVNRLCGSSLQAVHFAAQAVMAGTMDLVVGAGVESMSRVAMGSDAGPLSDAILDRFDIVSQGISAELICDRFGYTRHQLDALAVESHRRAVEAMDSGHFDREIAPVTAPDGSGGTRAVARDEGPRRDTSLEKVGRLRPAFRDDGRVTAASSSQISDGAAALLIGTRERAEALGLRPRARFVSMAVTAGDPTIMLLEPAPATRKALAKAGLTLGDIGLFEVNEAFAPPVLAWRDLLADEPGAGDLLERTNVNGGAMALGHPLGATGARLLVTLLHEMERRDVEFGLATLCIGFGQAVASIIQRV